MDPAKMKVVDLRSELGALGLDTKGNKPALVERLKKALEAKTGKVLADTSILDTTTEDLDDVATPRRPGPAARTTRRSSSSRLVATPSRQPPRDGPELIEEDVKEEDSDDSTPVQPAPVPVPTPAPVVAPVAAPEPEPHVDTPRKPAPSEPYVLEEEETESSPVQIKEDLEDNETADNEDCKARVSTENENKVTPSTKNENMDHDGEENGEDDKPKDTNKEDKHEERELTEEEEWEKLNERLKIREQERLEREKKQAEDDAKRLEELSNDPIKLQRLKRKHEKKARWSNFYKTVAVTNEVLTLPTEPTPKKGKNEIVDPKLLEPEINDERVTLSWYDSDLNQYLELPELNSVVPLSESVFAHSWAGSRASHGVTTGRVCYEVRVGAVVTTTESSEKEPIGSGLRVGWSTDDSSLHLGEGELSWGYESTGRAVHNGEFKEYGKQLTEKDVIGIYLDLESSPCKISFTVNGVEQGTAFEFDKSVLNDKALFPHIITKNLCYKVNFGYDRYNMLTKTKIVRKRIEIPVEQVLEEKKALEDEIKRQKEEAIRREKERRDRERKEREERQRKKREERERLERERKEKERKEKGEEEAEESEKDKDKEEMDQSGDGADQGEPKENGDKTDESQPPAVEVKEEPMETDQTEEAPKPVEATDLPEVKGEAVDDDVVEVTEEQVLRGHVLDKRIKFVIRHTAEEQLEGAEACLVPGYVLLALYTALVPGPRRPATKQDCEVILMVGMPGSGKTHWAKEHAAKHPERRYNLVSTGALFDRMKVDCKPFRSSYEGRWDAMISKCAKCVLKLLEIAKGRRRNYILDQPTSRCPTSAPG
ncbi:heterogeneous nuclear ribonucleoprotein U-like protein 2 [Achroia grisella]|uniref:heterogeneous nuclear ribonucleoprotein U-like protein 2 n=1 Tax=Achroia grisella TaxID=688607 RepID=UPI0027D26C96|nr:heterogeneous nuclear ribonucleoprotein U-like protein 2 [Achroia grisella]